MIKYMCLLFETIKLENGVFHNLRLHAERINDARKKLFNLPDKIELSIELKVPESFSKGLYKCRIDYDKGIQKISFEKYKARKIGALQLVHCDNISYNFKFSDRSCFDKIKRQSKGNEILIIRNGLITDTSFSNIVFFDGQKWITPSSPLLEGTRRKELLSKGKILEQKIGPSDIKSFTKARLINAMLDLKSGTEININQILFA